MDQINEDVVAVTRHDPVSHKSVILVARTQFKEDRSGRVKYIKPIYIDGKTNV